MYLDNKIQEYLIVDSPSRKNCCTWKEKPSHDI